MSRNLNEIVCSGMRLQDKLSDLFCKKECSAVVSARAHLSLDERPSTLLRHFFFPSLTEQPQLFSFLPDFWEEGLNKDTPVPRLSAQIGVLTQLSSRRGPRAWSALWWKRQSAGRTAWHGTGCSAARYCSLSCSSSLYSQQSRQVESLCRSSGPSATPCPTQWYSM